VLAEFEQTPTSPWDDHRQRRCGLSDPGNAEARPTGERRLVALDPPAPPVAEQSGRWGTALAIGVKHRPARRPAQSFSCGREANRGWAHPPDR